MGYKGREEFVGRIKVEKYHFNEEVKNV